MTFLEALHGISLTVCSREFNLESLCIHRAIIDVFNLLLAFVLFLVMIIGFTSRIHVRLRRRDWIDTTISICCAFLAVVYFAFSFLNASTGSDDSFSWLAYLFRGLIWTTLSLSVLVHGARWLKFLTIGWWVVFGLLISALNIEFLVKFQSIELIEIAAWIGNFLLVFCAFRIIHLMFTHRNTMENNTLSEPLLGHDKSSTSLDRASFFSELFFTWINPLLKIGNSKTLALEDIPSLVSEDEAVLAYERFAEAWSSFQKGKQSNNNAHDNLAIRAITKVYWKKVILAGIYAIFRVVSVVVAPLLLFAFVNYHNRETKGVVEGLVLVGLLVLTKVVESLSYRHFFFYSRRIGMTMRSALMVAAFRKQLRLSSLGKRRHSSGEVVNYIAVDAYRMGDFVMWFHLGWTSALQLLLSIVVLYGIVGIGVLPALVPMLICSLLNVPFAKMLQKCQLEFMNVQDKRIRAMSEILNNMKIIKLQSWEEKFKKLIESYRETEFKWLSEFQIKKTYNTVLYWMCPTIISSVIFFGCILLKSAQLDAGTVFTILAALRCMSEPVRVIPEALSMLMQVKVSFDRINLFLHEDEIKHEDSKRSALADGSDITIHIEAGNFSWEADLASLTVKNVSLKVSRGQKVAVCGLVGSGKSSLLYAILGEIPKVSGDVNVYGSVAYVSQASWIQSGTIRENILYGKPMNKVKYDEAIRVTALDKDIESFDYGDLTEIGQRGVNMSGGQKQRIQLARAVYSDADIYLLDDPFSAVDAHTATVLFNVMEGGRITQAGSYTELLSAGTAFGQLVVAHRKTMTLSDSQSLNTKRGNETKSANVTNTEGRKQSFSKESSEGEISMIAGVQLTEEEEKEIGDVGIKPFWDYVSVSKGFFHLLGNVITQSGFVILQAAASYWLAFAIQSPKISSVAVVSVYTLISTISAFFVYLRSLFAVLLGLRASKSFFSGFTNSVFNAPMLFFDSTPVGRILTRASSDLSVLDFDIPLTVAFVMAATTELIATIGIMASVTWQVLVVGIIASIASKYVQNYYQPTARELMRINGTTKAPIMNYTSETSLGVATIRAFNMSDRFFQHYLKLVDTDAKVFLFSNAAMEWLVLWNETLQNITLFTAAFLLVFLPQDYVSPGLVGLSLSYAFALTSTQVFLSRWYTSLANYIISVERIKQFMHISPQPPAIVEDKRPPSSWPSKGRIELLDLKIKYRPNAPIVLKGITCTFKEGTRVGVVGRTGSGKTTLISALFRLVDPFSGQIIVDGIDICSIGLKDLRLKLSIIPQEPTLFRGSIRTNMDPLGIYSDDEIWKALEKCQLKDTVSKLPNLLDSSVSDEGENWSMGQRQLFCLGRVLLRRNKILVLDEATASIDSATDAILQRVIREEFPSCTVITVAHRVPTVIDSDMVMVLSFGKLVEYEEPSKLMETNSSFSKLVAEYWSSCRNNSFQNLEDLS
ncbi:OLC1v1014977C1 [Oldenlandia corymbosa var. corymbosa]|uniref:ABC-type xenobiotic transporter n=1 Tax=Oldenlandia corymbosa var. corymbosa TaxID=529605 RepID=A0AAV1E275_OLDCO|nr:OLC1v1014977C1 [Oldenlandia corymbosa var. corymbosa]